MFDSGSSHVFVRRAEVGSLKAMKHKGRYAVVFVTAPDVKTGRKLARAALSGRLIACANLIPRIESHYWWQGKIQAGAEVLLVMKTTVARLTALEKLIVATHPYDTPEFIVLPIVRGTRRYLNWVSGSVK
jgi:periplasmic divalent cation tolerance protein